MLVKCPDCGENFQWNGENYDDEFECPYCGLEGWGELEEIDEMTADNRTMPIRTMAATIWGEARGEPWPGKIAVGYVILNRSCSPGWWGNDIHSVCLKEHQFSCWWDEQRQHVISVDVDNHSFIECLYAASWVIDGRVSDPTAGADHYYAGETPPDWAISRRPCAIIGRHKFFRLGLS